MTSLNHSMTKLERSKYILNEIENEMRTHGILFAYIFAPLKDISTCEVWIAQLEQEQIAPTGEGENKT